MDSGTRVNIRRFLWDYEETPLPSDEKHNGQPIKSVRVKIDKVSAVP
jgi:hypothetical protein